MLTLIRELIGGTYYTVEPDTLGGIHIVYNLEYIVAAVLLILFNVGIFVLLSNFQKSMSRRSKE